MKTEAEATRAIDLYGDTIRRICFMHLKNYTDVEDIFQEVFMKYVLFDVPFESQAHEKAWLIRVAINSSKDLLRNFFRRNVTALDDSMLTGFTIEQEDKGVLEAVMSLPVNYKNVIYLFYYEGYSAVDIAKLLNKKENTIYTWLARGRQKLKEMLGGEEFGR